MSRTVLTLCTLVLTGFALVSGSFAQDSVFRYASDPFSGSDSVSADAAEESSPEESETNGANDDQPKETYDSYESWPTGSKSAKQEKAAFRAKQRELRIATRKWYGFSAARPAIYGNPHYNTYMVGSYSGWSNRYWAPRYRSNSSWYYPRQSYSSTRWIAIPADSTFAFSR